MHKIRDRKRFLLPLIWALFSMLGHSQEQNNLDELYTAIYGADRSPVERAVSKVDIANYYIYHDLDSASYYIDQVLTGLKEGEFILPDTFHRHFLIKAWTHQGKQEYAAAKQYIYKAIKAAGNTKNRDDKLELIMNLGSLLVQTRDTSVLSFVTEELSKVDTTLSRADYIMYTLLHQYQSQAYAQKEDYEKAIKSLLKIGGAAFLNKIPSYRYGIRSSMSKYLAFMGDHNTAASQLETALKDTLHKHQKRQIYYDLSLLKLKIDSIEIAEQYLDRFRLMAGSTDLDQRDLFYLSSQVVQKKGDIELAMTFVDSAMVHQKGIENNQKLLDVLLLKAALSEKARDIKSVSMCVNRTDSLLAIDKSLANAINMAKVSRLKLLHTFLTSDESIAVDFAAYEASQSNLIEKKIDPDLVAAVLNFDNEEKAYEIDQLSKLNAAMDFNLEKQSTRLYWTFGFVFLLSVFSIFLYRRSKKRKIYNEKILAEKLMLERKADEKKHLADQALKEKERLEKLAAAERKRLEDQQKILQSRVSQIEQSKHDLEQELLASRKQKHKDVITITTSTKVHKIKIDQLMYVTAENDGTRFYLRERNFWIVVPLKEIIKQLPESKFVRIFRSTVVNVDFISAVNSKFIVLENGEELVMGRTYSKEVRKRVG